MRSQTHESVQMTLADVKAASQSNPDSPGPGNYSPVDSMTRRLSPSFAFGGNLGKMDRATTGALAQSLRSSSPVRGDPGLRVDRDGRLTRLHVRRSPPLPLHPPATQGPGHYKANSSVGSQSLSGRPTASRTAMPRGPRYDTVQCQRPARSQPRPRLPLLTP